jgi:tetratricopeptide (TPR) repeat protein
MAKKEEENLIDVGKVYSKSEEFVENNKKPIMIAIVVLIVAVAGFLGYSNYLDGQNTEAAESIWKAEYYFEIDSLDKAIVGDGQYFGFEYISDNYGQTKTGKLANYYLGIIYKEKGEYDLALEYLKDANVKDEVIGAIALGNIGDIYIDLGDYQEALKYFNKAISHSDNSFTAPIYLNKAALTYTALENYKKATEFYQQIVDDYPNSPEAREVKKNLAMVKQLAG